MENITIMYKTGQQWENRTTVTVFVHKDCRTNCGERIDFIPIARELVLSLSSSNAARRTWSSYRIVNYDFLAKISVSEDAGENKSLWNWCWLVSGRWWIIYSLAMVSWHALCWILRTTSCIGFHRACFSEASGKNSHGGGDMAIRYVPIGDVRLNKAISWTSVLQRVSWRNVITGSAFFSDINNYRGSCNLVKALAALIHKV